MSQLKVIITCPIHEDFLQCPTNHLHKQGCPDCANEKRDGGYQLHLALQGHYNFSGYLYKIKLSNDDKIEFIKIGISKNLEQRLERIRNQSKCNIEIIETQFFDDSLVKIIKEHELHEYYKDHSYLPNIKFSGRYECYKSDSIILMNY